MHAQRPEAVERRRRLRRLIMATEDKEFPFSVKMPVEAAAGVAEAAPAPAPVAPAPLEDIKARRRRILEERAKRDTKYREEDETRALDFHELLIKLEDSTGGRRGRDFEIVDAGKFGFVAVARKEAVLWKSYRAKMLKDRYVPTHEEVLAFVRPQVIHPPLVKFDEIIGEVAAVADVCANALVGLYGVKEQDDAGK